MCLNFLTYLLNSSISVWRSLVFQFVERFHWWSLHLKMLGIGLQLNCWSSREVWSFFSDFHYGFKSFWSTVDLVFNSSGTTRAVALDISKAFNMVWHAGLLHKLKSYEISGQIFSIISFLHNRRLWEELNLCWSSLRLHSWSYTFLTIH